ncbi:MAG: hypothetical protein ACYC5O_00230 [Anaerolineae bacterium]
MVTDGTVELEGYSYRTSSRFGSVVRVRIGNGMASVSGPRLDAPVYRVWLGVQAVLMALVAPLLMLAALRRRGRYALTALGVVGAHGAFGGFGAGCLWELQRLIDFGAGKQGSTASFPLSAVRDVRIGKGWARKGLSLIIMSYVPGINSMAEGLAVSFEAPDEQTGNDVVYALHMRTIEEAQALAAALGGGR